MPANQLFADWVTGDLITASKLNQMKNDLAALSGAIFSGVLTVAPNTGQVLNLKGGSSDHAYLGFYARSADQNARSGYIGYGSPGTDVLNIANERPGGLVAVNNAILPTERGDINFNSDWNSYTTPGYYRVLGEGSSPANTPPASFFYGVLLVIKAGTSLTQLYTQHVGSGTFVRQAWSWNDWAPWVELSPNFKNRFTVSGNVGGQNGYTQPAFATVAQQEIPIQTNNQAIVLRRARFSLPNNFRLRISNQFLWTSSNNLNDVSPNFTLRNTDTSLSVVSIQLENLSGNPVQVVQSHAWWVEFELV